MFRVKPMSKSYLAKKGAISIKSVIVAKSMADQIDVLSTVPYNIDQREENPKVDMSLYQLKTFIDLSIPIVNMYLAGTDFSVFKKILNKNVLYKMFGSIWRIEDFILGTNVIRVDEDGSIVPLSPNMIDRGELYSSKFKIGGLAVLEILKNFDVDEAIKHEITSACVSVIGSRDLSKYCNNDIGTITVNPSENDIWIIDKYYLKPSNDLVRSVINKYSWKVRDILLLDSKSKGVDLPIITALINYKEDPDRFHGFIQDFIPVLPLGYRPTIGDMKDPLTELYNRVVKANNELKYACLISSSTLNYVRLKYASFYRLYINLVKERSAYDSPKFKALLEIMKGKEGIIRNNVQASIIDFSARSVITVDPEMSIDTIGVPESIALSLVENDVIKILGKDLKNKAEVLDKSYYNMKVDLAKKILDGSYILTGRQPTLYMLSVQALKVKVVKGSSIVISPIITSAFNADLDGDQMYLNMPQSEKAREEAKKILANVNNVFHPRDGSCHLGPRQEIIYGLYICNTIKSNKSLPIVRYSSYDEFRCEVINNIKEQSIQLSTQCIIGEDYYETVGIACLRAFLSSTGSVEKDILLGVSPITTKQEAEYNYNNGGILVKEKVVNESFYKEYFKYVKLTKGTDEFIKVANNTVRLGFVCANMYGPSLNIFEDIQVSEFIDDFYRRIDEREEYYNLGFDTEVSYSLFYSNEYNILEKKVKNYLKENMSRDNGFMGLVVSGARGNMSNIMQMFGMKGAILKNNVESFNAIIKTPLCNGLSGLEHFFTAYGSREGIIDKVIRTFEPGYFSRQMSHVTRHIVITSEDCGTKNGLLLEYDFLKEMYGTSELSGDEFVDITHIKSYALRIMEGRYIVEYMTNNPITRKEASYIFDNFIARIENNTLIKGNGVHMRSVLFCNDQCCSKCYGVDLMTNKNVIVGTPVGFIASQTIGEPVTQLIMKNFQKGGVAGLENLTSSFDSLKELIQMTPLSKGNDIITHDFISPVEGYTQKQKMGDGIVKLQIINPNNGKNVLKSDKYFYESMADFKDYVCIGDSVFKEQGTLDPNEILEIRGIDACQMHILFTAYNIFLNEVFVNFKHFEILAHCMRVYVCSKSPEGSFFKFGNYYTAKDVLSHDKTGCVFSSVIRGIKYIPRIHEDYLTALFLEDIARTSSRNIVVSGKDSLKDPFVRISLGLKPYIGTYYDGYLEKRGLHD